MTCMLFGLLFVQMVRVFDITRPGRDFESRPTSKTRKSKHGQRCVCLGCPEFGLPPVSSRLHVASLQGHHFVYPLRQYE